MVTREEELLLYGEKALHQPVDPRLLAYCPSMELLALGSKDQQVLIYRQNGQRVYGATQKGTALTVDRISWKPNGQLLGIAWSDGVVRLVGAESSKTVHQISTGSGNSGITCLGWTSASTTRKPLDPKSFSSWTDLLEEVQGGHGSIPSHLDLPRDLSLIDIEASMPKLSVLPAGATADDIFSTRASIDGIFRTFDPKDNDSVDVMIVGTTDGRVHLSIYDSFIVGSFPSPLDSAQVKVSSSELVAHASSSHYSTHALLFRPSRPSDASSFYFVPMDLRFVSASTGYLSLLASKSTALQNLLRYIDQVQVLMSIEWEATQDLPRKFLRNINEELAEKNRCDIVQAMYHSVATGHTFPTVREWLVDELAERGHKRWDKAVSTALENLRKLVHEDMLPALERCSVILSRLGGIAKYQGSNDTMGFSNHQISLVMDTVACLNLACARILTYTVDELDMFTAFSAWLRHEIDRLATDASSSPNDDNADKDSILDHSKVLLYIQTAMTNSRLGAFFKDPHSENENGIWDDVESGLPLFETVDRDLRKNDEGLSQTKLTRIDLLCKHLSHQANAVFQQIADSEKRNVLFGKTLSLGVISTRIPIMKVHPENINSCKVYIGQLNDNMIIMTCISLCIENGISTQTSVTNGTIDFGSYPIFDLAFADTQSLLVLYSTATDEPPKLVNIPYQTVIHFDPGTVDQKADPPLSNIRPLNDIIDQMQIYTFPDLGAFLPNTLTIGEHISKGLRKLRICVLDKTRLQYRVFTIREAQREQKLSTERKDEDVQMTQE